MKKKLTWLLATLIFMISISTVMVFATETTDASLRIYGANLSLENAVYMNFKVESQNITDKNNIKLLVWEEYPTAYEKGTESACLSATTANDTDGYTVFKYTNLAAKDMTKQIYVCAYANIDGTEVYSKPVKYSIIEYAYRMKPLVDDVNFDNLIDGMLAYGALAQTYFNYNTDFLATDTVYEITVNSGTLEDGFTYGLYQEGATATLTANEAEEGYVFSHWTNSAGENIGETETLEVIVNSAETYTAVYKKYSEGLEYSLIAGGYIIESIGTCTDTDVLIPPTYESLPVIGIDSRAFYGCSNLTSIVIPDGVTRIADYAFFSCSNLTSITIPSTVQNIGRYAFQNCSKLKTVYYKGNISDWLNIEHDKYVSSNPCLNGADLFFNNELVTNIVVPEGITNINNSAFQGCTSLNSIILPDSVTNIGNDAFFGCTNLVNISISKNVTNIGNHAFFGCTSLTSVDIPDNVTSIGKFSFSNCTNLANIKLLAKLTTISECTFLDCGNLTSIILPYGITNIDESAFAYCWNLKNITIPKTVINISSAAFNSCGNLSIIYYAGTAEEWTNISIYNFGNDIFKYATIYYYSETAPTVEGNYWHYVDDVPTAW